MQSKFFDQYFKFISNITLSANEKLLIEISKLAIEASNNSKKIIVVGNGGSAAMSSHVSVDFTKVAGLRAINFNEADLITCYSNDYGYEKWVAEAIKSYADFGDLVILISSSGKSANILNGAIQAKKMGLNLVTLTGFSNDNPLKKIGDINLWADSDKYNIVEMVHHIWLLSIVDFIIESRAS
jgi:D-sedoheptulose 7-phosphate isomerase